MKQDQMLFEKESMKDKKVAFNTSISHKYEIDHTQCEVIHFSYFNPIPHLHHEILIDSIFWFANR